MIAFDKKFLKANGRHVKKNNFLFDNNGNLDEEKSLILNKFEKKQNFLLDEKYLITDRLSENLEYITYFGRDIKNNLDIIIRKFYPKELYENKYESSKKIFLEYYKSIAAVKNIDSIEQIYDIIDKYDTIFVISEAIKGVSLYNLLKKNKKPFKWATAKILFMPLISAFDKLYEAKIIHSKINPHTLILKKNGKLCAVGFSPPNFKNEVYSEFLAPEQYIDNKKITQTIDIYGLSATLFYTLFGFTVKNDTKKLKDERILIPAKLLKNVPPHVVKALANGLKADPTKRTQNFNELRNELTKNSAKNLINQVKNQNNNSKKNHTKKIVIFLFILFILTCSFLGFNIFKITNNNFVTANKTINDIEFVPDFTGKNFEEIKNNNNLNKCLSIYLSEKIYDDNIPDGFIISQIPVAGSKTSKNSSIAVKVSKGPKYKILPQIENQTLESASEILTKAGFIPIQENEFSKNVPQGQVIGYKNRLNYKNEKIEVGSEIIILVSKGPIE